MTIALSLGKLFRRKPPEPMSPRDAARIMWAARADFNSLSACVKHLDKSDDDHVRRASSYLCAAGRGVVKVAKDELPDFGLMEQAVQKALLEGSGIVCAALANKPDQFDSSYLHNIYGWNLYMMSSVKQLYADERLCALARLRHIPEIFKEEISDDAREVAVAFHLNALTMEAVVEDDNMFAVMIESAQRLSQYRKRPGLTRKELLDLRNHMLGLGNAARALTVQKLIR